VRITGVDLRLFDFDYDLTWAGFFLSADERVYGRYGTRDARGPDERLSLAGLRHAMSAALRAHRSAGEAALPARAGKALLAEEHPAAKRMRRGECIHCHQVYEHRREQRRSAGLWHRDELWVYPLPENVGLTLEVDRGDQVRAVAGGSAAERAGLRAGDRLTSLNGIAVASIADAQHGLHLGPATGQVPVTWERDGQAQRGTLELAQGWRKTNVTWRPSMLDLLPSLPVVGDDLTAAEKRALGLAPGRLAFRQGKPTTDLRAAGLREGDVVIGLSRQTLEMTVEQFLAHVRRNHLVGERITLDVLRDGKRLEIALVLR
jgi:hypothetical protein